MVWVYFIILGAVPGGRCFASKCCLLLIGLYILKFCELTNRILRSTFSNPNHL